MRSFTFVQDDDRCFASLKMTEQIFRVAQDDGEVRITVSSGVKAV